MSMSGNALLKRLLDAGMNFTEISQDQAEKLVKEFVKGGQARRKDTEKLVHEMVERGRSATEGLVSTVQAEISKQLGKFASRLDDVESRVEVIAQKVGLASKPAAKAAPVKKAAPAKKAPAAKAAPVKKAAVKKA